ncbi:SufD family Fe-S cluster assembly protein [Paracoccus suum]|uniref:SufD family Fe-S cluster assembly protein n=1 Tax=Paracoccus suum TaxID=2259340 RepID=A0A344PGZ0_9RHOB|nr:SufD family Fe-S cluster assembly protein [Paracoccus suum]AXC48645.1 SufD family Fe-S cluster assembly protein [Paracoccus suum]
MADLSPVLTRTPASDSPLGVARQAAEDRLAQLGLPGRRDEYWRFAGPADFSQGDAPSVALPQGDGTLFSDLDRLTLVFVDGRFDAAASDPLPLDGVEIAPLAAAPDWARRAYGAREAAAHIPVPRPLAAMNTARAADGLAIRVTGRPTRPLHILHRRTEAAGDAVWHHVIHLEPGAELTLIETGSAGSRQNSVIEADLADGAKLHLIAAKRRGDELALSHLFARLGNESVLKSFALALDGRHLRREAVIDVVGDDAVVHLAGAALGDGRDFINDDTVFIIHGGLRGESRQVFKKVLRGSATGIFQGKILVRPGAQKTDGYQISQSLLLDELCQFLAKPELEIYADDVKCSHGSTTGAIDETALFYLRSRGVPKAQAEVLLVLSFLADALAEIEDDGLRSRISARVEEALTADAGQIGNGG